MATVWISTRLCNHAVCLVPRIAGGCLAPEAKANTSRTGHLINPGCQKRVEQNDFRGQASPGLCLPFYPLKSLESEERLSALTGRYFPQACQLVTLPPLSMHTAVIIPLSKTIRPQAIFSWHLDCQDPLNLCQ